MANRFEVLNEGFVIRGPLAACSRVAVVDDRELVSAYVTPSGAGTADYTDEQVRSLDRSGIKAELARMVALPDE